MTDAAHKEQTAPRRLIVSTAAEKSFSDHITFPNIVIFIVSATGLILLGGLVSVTAAITAGLLGALIGVAVREARLRRRWERDILSHLQRLHIDYERLVRDSARTRSETSELRQRLSDAGQKARGIGRMSDDAQAEQRMIRAVVEQLAVLTETKEVENTAAPELPATLDREFLRKQAEKGARGEIEIGRRLNDAQVLQLVEAAVRQDRIDLFVQSVVNLPQRKLRFYETFSRIRILPDVYLPASRYVEVAMKKNLLPVIDNLLLLRGLQAIQKAAASDYNHSFFFNITSLTLNDPKFMGDLVEFIAQNRALAPQLIFEMAQDDLATLNEEMLPTMDGLAGLGCRFSMDRVKSLSFNLNTLEARRIRFIKVEARILLSALREAGGLARLKRMKGEFDRHGIDLIVEKVETERQLLELLDIEVDYGQGFLFSKPHLYQKAA